MSISEYDKLFADFERMILEPEFLQQQLRTVYLTDPWLFALEKLYQHDHRIQHREVLNQLAVVLLYRRVSILVDQLGIALAHQNPTIVIDNKTFIPKENPCP